MTCTATPALLTAPTLPQALRNGINALAAAQLLVDIAPYPGMDDGDLIELFWNNCFAASRRVTACEVGMPTRLRVPESFVQEGVAQVHYQIMQVGRAPARSAMTHLRVKTNSPGGLPCALYSGENQNLAPVGLPDTIRRYGVNAEPGAAGDSADHRALPEHDHRRCHHPALGRRTHGPAEDTGQGRRPGGAGLGAADVDSRGRRRQPVGGDLLHSGPGRQQFALGASPDATYCRQRDHPSDRHRAGLSATPSGLTL